MWRIGFRLIRPRSRAVVSPNLQGRPGVRRLVKRDREEDDGELDREVDDLEGERVHRRRTIADRPPGPGPRRSAGRPHSPLSARRVDCSISTTSPFGDTLPACVSRDRSAKPSGRPGVSLRVVPIGSGLGPERAGRRRPRAPRTRPTWRHRGRGGALRAVRAGSAPVHRPAALGPEPRRRGHAGGVRQVDCAGAPVRRQGGGLLLALRHRGQRLPGPPAPGSPGAGRPDRRAARAGRAGRRGRADAHRDGETGRRPAGPRGALRGAARSARPRPLSRSALRRRSPRSSASRSARSRLASSGPSKRSRSDFPKEPRHGMPRTRRTRSRPPDRGDASLSEAARELEEHLAGCAACRAESDAVRRAWEFLGEDPRSEASARVPAARPRARRGRDCSATASASSVRGRAGSARPRRPRRCSSPPALGYLAAGAQDATPARSRSAESPAPAVASEVPDFGSNPRLSNLSYGRPPTRRQDRHRLRRHDAPHRRGRGLATRGGEACSPTSSRETARTPATSRARSSSCSSTTAARRERRRPPPDIVAALTNTLRRTRTRACARRRPTRSAGMPMTPEIRSAFLDALRDDSNPAVRLVAIESLAAAAKESPTRARSSPCARRPSIPRRTASCGRGPPRP